MIPKGDKTMNNKYTSGEKEYKITIGDTLVTVILHLMKELPIDATKTFTQLDWHKQVHIHSTYEIFWVGDGEMSIITEDETLKCNKSVVIFPPGCRHYTMNGGGRLGTMFFQLEKIQAPAPDAPHIFDAVTSAMNNKPYITDILSDEIFYITKVFDSKKSGIATDDFHFISLLFSCLFGRMVTTPKEDKQDKYKIYINTIEDYIHDNYTSSIHISNIAELLYISPKQVTRIIKRAYNCTLSELINTHRVMVACMLLTRTNMKIEEISASIGYEYPHRFFQNFKKIYGITPAQYRRSNQKN